MLTHFRLFIPKIRIIQILFRFMLDKTLNSQNIKLGSILNFITKTENVFQNTAQNRCLMLEN